MNASRTIVAIAACLGAALSAACKDDNAPDSIVIGAIMTSDISDSARSRLLAAELAISDVNAANVFSRKIEIRNLTPSVGDSPSAEVAAQNARMLHDGHNAVAVISIFSSLAEAIIDVTNGSEYENFVQCSASATRVTLNDPAAPKSDKTDAFYRTVVNDTAQGTLMDKVVRDRGWTQVGMYWLDDAFGSGLRGVFKSVFATPLVLDQSFPPGDFQTAQRKTELDAIIAKSQADELEVLLVVALANSTASVVDYLTDNGFEGGIVLTDGGKDKGLFDRANNISTWLEQPDNVLFGTEPDNFGGKNSDAFAAAYRARYSDEPNTYAPTAYDCAMAIAYAMLYSRKTDSFFPADIKTHIRNFKSANRVPGEVEVGIGAQGVTAGAAAIADDKRVDYRGASGSLIFDEQGDRPSQGMRTYQPNTTRTDWEILDRYDAALNKLP